MAWNIEYFIALSDDEDAKVDAMNRGMNLPAGSGVYVSFVHASRWRIRRLRERPCPANDGRYFLTTCVTSFCRRIRRA